MSGSDREGGRVSSHMAPRRHGDWRRPRSGRSTGAAGPETGSARRAMVVSNGAVRGRGTRCWVRTSASLSMRGPSSDQSRDRGRSQQHSGLSPADGDSSPAAAPAVEQLNQFRALPPQPALDVAQGWSSSSLSTPHLLNSPPTTPLPRSWPRRRNAPPSDSQRCCAINASRRSCASRGPIPSNSSGVDTSSGFDAVITAVYARVGLV